MFAACLALPAPGAARQRPTYDVVVGTLPHSGAYDIRATSGYRLDVVSPMDVACDSKGQVHVAVGPRERVYTLDHSGKCIRELDVAELPKPGRTPHPHRILLAVDAADQLFVNVLDGEYERRICVFGGEGSYHTEFPFSGAKPVDGERVTEFVIGREGSVLIGTTQWGPPGSDLPVYAYDANGRFNGMTDLLHIDAKGNAYRLVQRTDSVCLLSYAGYTREPLRSSASLTRRGEVFLGRRSMDHRSRLGELWLVAGFDSAGHVCVTNGLVVRMFDAGLRERRVCPLRMDLLQEAGIVTSENNVAVAPDATVYVYGVRRTKNERNPSTAQEFILLRLADL